MQMEIGIYNTNLKIEHFEKKMFLEIWMTDGRCWMYHDSSSLLTKSSIAKNLKKKKKIYSSKWSQGGYIQALC